MHRVFQTNNENFGAELWDESFRMGSCAFFTYEVPLPTVLDEFLSFLLYNYVPVLFTLVWRSIPVKIQCCILHSTFRILSYICYLTSEFTLSSFNFPRATFKFLLCTFTFSYAIFKFTFKFSGLHFKVFAFNVEHLPIKFLLSTFDFTYFTCKFALYIQLFKLYFSSAGHPPRVIGGLN